MWSLSCRKAHKIKNADVSGFHRLHWYPDGFNYAEVSRRKQDLGLLVPRFSARFTDPLVFRLDGMVPWFTCWESFYRDFNHKQTQDALRFFGRALSGNFYNVKSLFPGKKEPSVPVFIMYAFYKDYFGKRLDSRIDYNSFVDSDTGLFIRFYVHIWDSGRNDFSLSDSFSYVFKRDTVRKFLSGFDSEKFSCLVYQRRNAAKD